MHRGYPAVERHGYGARPQPCCPHSAAVNYGSRIRGLTGSLIRRVISVLRGAQSRIDVLLSEPGRVFLAMWFVLHACIGWAYRRGGTLVWCRIVYTGAPEISERN